ncbi:hypothetical protein FACS1894216_06050 [Synergistales bacterium]|nr:hypothetical protein FACS1894216_06050 [Synergistales bacterium]
MASGYNNVPMPERHGKPSSPVRLDAWGKPLPRLKLVVIISDGVPENAGQSLGVASWLARRTNADVMELAIPELNPTARRKLTLSATKLLQGNRRKARDWLAQAGALNITRQLGQWVTIRNIKEGDAASLVIISAGSVPAFYNVALGYIWRCTCATIMTPSVLGAEPFDFAIIPAHDFPLELSNIMTTTGAPNTIVRDELAPAAELLLKKFPPLYPRRWGMIIGGGHDGYTISAEWVHRTLGKIFREAAGANIDLYITTSRGTPTEAEAAIQRLASNSSNVRFLLLASDDETNHVPAMLGACDEIFVTDDSVYPASEAVTAGHRVILMRTERTGWTKHVSQSATSVMVAVGLLPKRALWGPPRYDRTFAEFEEMGALAEFKDWTREYRLRVGDENVPPEEDEGYNQYEDFNEARRAADWIIEKLGVDTK